MTTDNKDNGDIANSRRAFMKTAAGAGAGVVTIALLPQWVRPVAEFVVTPVKAAQSFFLADVFRQSFTTDVSSSDSDEAPEVSTTAAPTTTETTEGPTTTETTSGPTTTLAGTTFAPTTTETSTTLPPPPPPPTTQPGPTTTTPLP